MEQCKIANVPFFFKQWVASKRAERALLRGRTYYEFPRASTPSIPNRAERNARSSQLALEFADFSPFPEPTTELPFVSYVSKGKVLFCHFRVKMQLNNGRRSLAATRTLSNASGPGAAEQQSLRNGQTRCLNSSVIESTTQSRFADDATELPSLLSQLERVSSSVCFDTLLTPVRQYRRRCSIA